MNIALPAPNQTAVEISAAEGMCDALSRASAGFWLGGPMPPLHLRRIKFWKFDYEMVHSEVYLNKYVVSIAPFSPTPFRKLLFLHVFAFLIFHLFFQGVSWPHLPLGGRPCAPSILSTVHNRIRKVAFKSLAIWVPTMHYVESHLRLSEMTWIERPDITSDGWSVVICYISYSTPVFSVLTACDLAKYFSFYIAN